MIPVAKYSVRIGKCFFDSWQLILTAIGSKWSPKWSWKNLFLTFRPESGRNLWKYEQRSIMTNLQRCHQILKFVVFNLSHLRCFWTDLNGSCVVGQLFFRAFCRRKKLENISSRVGSAVMLSPGRKRRLLLWYDFQWCGSYVDLEKKACRSAIFSRIFIPTSSENMRINIFSSAGWTRRGRFMNLSGGGIVRKCFISFLQDATNVRRNNTIPAVKNCTVYDHA